MDKADLLKIEPNTRKVGIYIYGILHGVKEHMKLTKNKRESGNDLEQYNPH